jgi:energy-converting hydrogenase Eha subunit G
MASPFRDNPARSAPAGGQKPVRNELEEAMRNSFFIVGALLVIAGLLIASGMMRYQDRDKVVDFGKVEIEATHEKNAPLNLGYVLLAGGALLLVGGAVSGKRSG